MNDFVHLHTHTAYSLLDGHADVRGLARAAKNAGMRALAITDHGNLYGGIEFYQACQKEGIKPIIGVEAYIVPDISVRSGKMGDYNHCLLIATNNTGYRNLLTLISLSNTKGFYYKPRIDHAMLEQYHEGLVITSGCLNGVIPEALLAGRQGDAQKHLRWLREVFGSENVYLEVQNHEDSAEQVTVNQMVYALAQETGLPLLATNDLHYTSRADAPAQDLMLCTQMGKAFDDPNRMKFGSDNYYLRPAGEMAQLFSDTPEALRNTLMLAERCNVNIAFGQDYLPVVEPPAPFATGADYLRHMVEVGLRERYDTITSEIRQRVDYEFGIINAKGFVPYFLVVQDYVYWARRNGIRCVARGSVAGSIVAYALGFSNVDPLAYGLPFERFLNPERTSMPDIDMDFPDDKRALVIAYIANKYGWDHVAQIATFNVSAARAAVRDAGRAFNLRSEADLVSRLLPKDASMTLATAPHLSPEFENVLRVNQGARKVYEQARLLEGTVRSQGIHAAGLVISREPLMGIVPLQPRDRDGSPWMVSQYDQHSLEELGLLKMDMLGLSNLSTLQRTVDMVRETTGEVIDLDHLPLDDRETFELLSAGDTTGVFQLESTGMRSYLTQLKPTSVDDIMAMVALYRPGPMENIPVYIAAKNNPTRVKYPHPRLENILKRTYGVLVYQDQVLFAAIELAGYSWGEADKFRKAIGKKIRSEIEAQRKRFISGCIENGLTQDEARSIFDLIEPFANYGFNYGHAASYAMVAYQTAYLKAHYPAQFYAASMTTEASDRLKLALLVREARKRGIKVLAPDIIGSKREFTVERGAIRFGFCAINGVGDAAIQGVLNVREKHALPSLEDFFSSGERVTTATMERLIKCGAFDTLYSGENRATLLEWVKPLASYVRRTRTLKNAPQRPELPHVARETDDERRLWEFETMGVYLSGHPLDGVRERIEAVITHVSAELTADMDGAEIVLAGRVVEVKKRTTKGENKRDMATLVIEDLSGTVKAVMFPQQFERYGLSTRTGSIRVFHGRWSLRDEDGQLIISRVETLPELKKLESVPASKSTVVVSFPQALMVSGVMAEIPAVLKEHQGTQQWVVEMILGSTRLPVSACGNGANGDNAGVTYTPALKQALERIGCSVEVRE